MTLHDKLEAAVISVLPKNAPAPTFESDSGGFYGGVAGMPIATSVLRVTFGEGKGAHTVHCGLTGQETDADLDQYAQNIITAWKAAK